jgi:hypothetical protein
LLDLAARPGRRGFEIPALTPEIIADGKALEALPDADLDAEYEKAKAAAVRQMLDEQEARIFFNQPSARADHTHWAKCAYWQIYEGVALLLGKDPKVVNPDSLRPYSTHDFAKEFDRILDLAHRAVAWGQLTKPTAPGAFVVWARRYEIVVPADLETAVAGFGHFIGDWKTLYDKAKAELSGLQAKQTIEESLAKVSPPASQSALSTALPAKGADPRELDSLRKLCITMAVCGYGFDPRLNRSGIVGEIVGDMERLGLSLDQDTVRKHLKAGAEFLEPGVVENVRRKRRIAE